MFGIDPFGSHMRAQKRHGDVYWLRNLLLGDMVVVCHPEMIRQVFSAPGEMLAAGAANPMRGVLGEHSVVLLDGQDHIRQRRVVQPSFLGASLQRYAEAMREATDAEIDTWRAGETRPLLPAMQRITVEVILGTIFGLDHSKRHAALRERLRGFMRFVSSRMSYLFMHPALQRDFGGLSPWARLRRNRDQVDQLLYQEIAERRTQLAAGEPNTRDDVLSLLLQARSEDGQTLSDVELRDELLTLLIAGHDTTSTGLAWAFERLLTHPDILARVRDELGVALGDSRLEESQLGQLPYLDATLHEVLRMRPPVPFSARRLKAPYQLGPYSLPAGWTIIVSSIGAHCREESYPEPHVFRPERFLNQRVDRYRWIPFGGGARRCLGMAFAMLEMKVVLATILQRVEFELAGARPPRVALHGVVFAPEGGLPIHVRSVAPRKSLRSLPHGTSVDGRQPTRAETCTK